MFNISACSPPEEIQPPTVVEKPETPDNSDPPKSNSMKITIGNLTFNATLAQNASATAFTTMLPMTIAMSEMNRNEKYYNLPTSLPAATHNPGTIHTGDIMLYGSATLVVFYKTFSTSYSYTKIASIENASKLQEALGGSSVTVKFELN